MTTSLRKKYYKKMKPEGENPLVYICNIIIRQSIPQKFLFMHNDHLFPDYFAKLPLLYTIAIYTKSAIEI